MYKYNIVKTGVKSVFLLKKTWFMTQQELEQRWWRSPDLDIEDSNYNVRPMDHSRLDLSIFPSPPR